MVSVNVKGSHRRVDGVRSRQKSKGVDIFCLQEIPMGRDGEWYGVEGYVIIGGIGGIGGGYDRRRGKEAVVGMLVNKKWEKKMVVVERKVDKIGVRLRMGREVDIEIWSINVGSGKHRGYEWIEGDGNVVVMGDVNARSERWEVEGFVSEWEGKIVERWMDEYGCELGTVKGEVTRYGEGNGVRDGVIDIGVGVGDIRMEGRSWERIVGLDHRPVEMGVVIGENEVWEEEECRGMVDWE